MKPTRAPTLLPTSTMSQDLFALVTGGDGAPPPPGLFDALTLAVTGELTKTNDQGVKHWRYDKASQETQYSEQLYGKNPPTTAPVGPGHNVVNNLP
jgi:hypothetical protein